MNLLALDAARDGFSCAVLCDGAVRAVEHVDAKAALESGLAAVSRAMERAQMHGTDLHRIAVGIGPGSFTGVRIAISYAKSLAFAWALPLVGVNTFDAIEAGADVAAPSLCVVRGRKGVVSVRFRSAEPSDTPLRASGYVVDVLDQVGGGNGELRVIGDAEDVREGLVERGWSVHVVPSPYHPSAVAVAAVAQTAIPAPTPHAVRADYGELPAAQVPRR